MTKKILDKANEIIYNTISENDFESQNYLLAITFTLSNSEAKNHIRGIKKAIKHLERVFDEEYLLLYSLENGRKVFHKEINRRFLSYGQDLANILNHHDYMKFSDKLNVLFGKVELGYSRYFLQGKKTVLKFCPSENIYELDENTETDFCEILDNVSLIKENKKKNSQLKKYEKYFEFFPEKYYEKETNYIIDIEKSLFPLDEIDTKEFTQENVILKNLNSVNTAITISKLLKK